MGGGNPKKGGGEKRVVKTRVAVVKKGSGGPKTGGGN